MTSALLIEWSPTHVRVFDPNRNRSSEGSNLASALDGSGVGRDAIIAVTQRSSFIRVVESPIVSRSEAEKLIPFKLGPLLPLPLTEVVWGFRAHGGKAIVGAVKADSLRKLLEEAQAAGLVVKHVVPLAFGAWLAAHEKGLTNGAVVETRDGTLSVDIVSGGELAYSRSAPLLETDAEIQEEIATAFAIAKVAEGPVLALASPNLPAGQREPRSAIQFLADGHVIDRQLFSLELPERAEARRVRRLKATSTRALLAAIAAVIIVAFAVQTRTAAANQQADQLAKQRKALAIAKSDHAKWLTKLDSATQQTALLATAFHPAQSFGDVIKILGAKAPAGTWFTGLTMQRGKPLLIKGEATSGKALTQFLSVLEKEPRFRDMRISFANKAMIGEKPIVQFGITGHIVGNLPIDELTTKGGKP